MIKHVDDWDCVCFSLFLSFFCNIFPLDFVGTDSSKQQIKINVFVYCLKISHSCLACLENITGQMYVSGRSLCFCAFTL